jgi:hypothetical protein
MVAALGSLMVAAGRPHSRIDAQASSSLSVTTVAL